MIIIPNKEVENSQNYWNSIQQALSLWINPYLEENKKVWFRIALIELFDDKRWSKLYFDNEVRLEIEFNKEILTDATIGSKYQPNLIDIKDITWVIDDLDWNSAKILIFKYDQDNWILDFDFRYNQSDAKRSINRAYEFLYSAKCIVWWTEYTPNVLIYLLWSVAELIIDAKLSLLAQRPENNKSHTEKKTKVILLESFFSSEFSSLFLEISWIKNSARYADFDHKNSFPDCDIFNQKIDILEREISTIQLA